MLQFHWEMLMPLQRSLSGGGYFLLTGLLLAAASLTSADISTFQQGADGYDRAQDTSIRWSFTTNFGDTPTIESDHGGDQGAYESWSTNGGGSTILEAGNFYQRFLGTVSAGLFSVEAGPTYRYSRTIIRFRDVFGTGPNQVPVGAPINSATLVLHNTFDLGSEDSAGLAVLPDTLPGEGGVILDNPKADPKLNAGNMAIYPMLVPINYGTDDGTATKGRVTAMEKRRGKEPWSRDCRDARSSAPNDPFVNAFTCGPADGVEYDSSHPGSVEFFQDATPGAKNFDVTGLLDAISGDGVFITALNPPGELATLDLNYGQAYHSSEFGGGGASPEDIATRPLLIVDFVPEPTTLGLIAFGSLAILRRRR